MDWGKNKQYVILFSLYTAFFFIDQDKEKKLEENKETRAIVTLTQW